MFKLRTLIALSVSGIMLVGCAGEPLVKIPQPWCTIGGTIIGAGMGYGINEAVADDPEDSDVEAAAAGVAFGAATSLLLCGGDYPPKPEPAPAPAPVPAPDPCAPDDDGDGVNNCLDTCASTPAGVEVDAGGCPKVGATLMRLQGVNFAFDSATLTPESETVLGQAVQELRDAPSVSVRVEGHTDSVGSDAYNLGLSQRRAEAVVDYLISQGIEGTRLEPVGMGEGNPIETNDTDEGRYQNRRVDFIVISK
ncbi:MAG: OmpA family protein [Gammaproteobacteria bacterium]